MTDIFIEGGRTLLGEDIVETSLQVADGIITAVNSSHGRSRLGIDASGLKVLPGIVDLHGDAFERQMMPRPGVPRPGPGSRACAARIMRGICSRPSKS